MIPTTWSPSVTRIDPTFSSTIRLIASKTVAEASILRTSPPFLRRISETRAMGREPYGTARLLSPSFRVTPSGYKKPMVRLVGVPLALSLALAGTAADERGQQDSLVPYGRDAGFTLNHDSLTVFRNGKAASS